MIAYPQTLEQHNAMCAFMHHYAGVQQTPDMECIGWFDPETNELLMASALNAFMGKVCQIHIAMVPHFHFTPKAMLREVFNHAFNRRNRSKLLGIVNGNNEKAMRYDLHLGFKEVHRMAGMHSGGGDLVLLTLDREDCRYLNHPATKAA